MSFLICFVAPAQHWLPHAICVGTSSEWSSIRLPCARNTPDTNRALPFRPTFRLTVPKKKTALRKRGTKHRGPGFEVEARRAPLVVVLPLHTRGLAGEVYL